MEQSTTSTKQPVLAVPFITGLLVILFLNSCGDGTNVKDVVESPYKKYIEQTEKNISQLPKERKEGRATLYAELKANPAYGILVTNKDVSSDYLPVLTTISNGISFTIPKQFSLSEDVVKRMESLPAGKDKLDFAKLIIALAMAENGGVPSEIIEVFERYKNKFGIYGLAGVFVEANTSKESKIEYDYDLSPFFGILEPNNKEVLNSIYEAKQKRLSSWTNQEEAVFPYLASKEGYMNYVKRVYPESPYIINVDYEVTAPQLYAAYDANEVSADEKYKEKKIAVTGIVGTIGKDILDDPYVALEVDYLQSVACYFSKEHITQLSQLRKGERVTIIGECNGLTLTNVVLRRCELWQGND